MEYQRQFLEFLLRLIAKKGLKMDKNNNEARYVMFPIYLLNDFFTNRQNCLNKIIKYGIYYLSNKIEYKIKDIATQTIYKYYTDIEFEEQFDSKFGYEILGSHVEYRGGFMAGGFYPNDDEIENVLNIFNSDINFRNEEIESYKYNCSLSILNLKKNNHKSIIKTAIEIEKNKPHNVHAMININVLFDFRDNTKSEFEDIQLLFYIALKSIIGKRETATTNYKHIYARMQGMSCTNNISEYPIQLKKYIEIEHHKRKLMEAIKNNWGVKRYSSKGIRGVYFSTSSKVSQNELNSKVKTMKQKRLELKQKKCLK